MKVGVFTVLFQNLDFETMLDTVRACGVEAVEIGTGNYPGDAHCKPDELLGDASAQRRFLAAVAARGLAISALSCHGNPLHPNGAIAEQHHATFVKTVRLAEQLGVPVVNCFSGCPGDGEGSRYPNWPVSPWPNDYQELLDWQWREKVLPYWREWGRFAAEHGVRLGFELHGGFSVHNPATLLRLREDVGEVVGANLDPSHLFWQGIDPILAVRELGAGGAIHHVHAKDVYLDPVNAPRNGVLDMTPYSEIARRSWIFRTIGYGHGLTLWRDFVSALRTVGYDGVLSIEHEDALMSVQEGFRKAVETLRSAIIREAPTSEMWWA